MAATLHPTDWTRILDQVEDLAAQPGMTSSRAVAIVEHWILRGDFVGQKNLPNILAAEKGQWPRFSDGTPLYRLAPIDNRAVIVPTTANTNDTPYVVADLIDADTDAVVELGCGVGRHLFNIRDLMEHHHPRLRYFGGELSETGLAAARRLAVLEPERAPIVFHPFNHQEPDLSFLRGLRKVVLFTCHSLEQVMYLNGRLIQAILDEAESFRAVFIEPAGWQFDDEIVREAEAGTLPHDYAKISVFGAIDERYAAVMPVGTEWNRNLIAVMREYEKAGKIKIESVERNASGLQLYNPSTTIKWSRA